MIFKGLFSFNLGTRLAKIFILLILIPLFNVSIAQPRSKSKPKRVGSALCLKGRTQYTAVVKQDSVLVTAKKLIVELRNSSTINLKLIKRYKRMISSCNSESAPKANDQTLGLQDLLLGTSKLEFVTDFKGPISIQVISLDEGLSIVGNNPESLSISLSDSVNSAQATLLLKRSKFRSKPFKITVTRSNIGGTETNSPNTTVTPTNQNNNENSKVPIALESSLSVYEGELLEIQFQALPAKDNSTPITFNVISQPSIGKLLPSGLKYNYAAGHQPGNDFITFRAVQGELVSEPAKVNIQVVPKLQEFAGSPTSLEPYRETITTKEAVHLCNKISFGCSASLIQYGVSNGLTKFVDRLFEYQVSTDTEIANVANSFAPGTDSIWTANELRRWWVPYLVRGNGVKERMALFWHDHFAVNLAEVEGNFGQRQANRHNWLPEHLGLIRGAALGSFEVLYQGMHSDPAMTEWLDNNNNYYSTTSGRLFPNENYAREILELFSMGTVDFYTGLPNYDTDLDVKELTRAFTGINFQNGTNDTTNFFSNRWDPFDKTLFIGTSYQATGKFNFVSASEAILYGHVGTRRNIAGKLLRVLAIPDIEEAVVNELAVQLIAEKYQLQSVIKKIAKSSLMFSKKARYRCVVSPIEQILRLLRILETPITSQNTVDAILTYFSNSGQSPLRPDTVFGWKGCGVGERGTQIALGENWLGAVWSIERQRQLINLLEVIRVREFNSESISSSSYLEKLMPSLNATPLQITQNTSDLLGIELTTDELNYIVNEYFNKDRNSTSGLRQVVNWSSRTATSKRQKIAGLLVILMQHPRGMTY